MAEKRDYYEVLCISKDASKSEIKDAYRKLAMQYHPDRNKAADAEEKFKEISEAYAVLSDDQKRQQYDTLGHAGLASEIYSAPFLVAASAEEASEKEATEAKTSPTILK